jgi:hypothetical protein
MRIKDVEGKGPNIGEKRTKIWATKGIINWRNEDKELGKERTKYWRNEDQQVWEKKVINDWRNEDQKSG